MYTASSLKGADIIRILRLDTKMGLLLYPIIRTCDSHYGKWSLSCSHDRVRSCTYFIHYNSYTNHFLKCHTRIDYFMDNDGGDNPFLFSLPIFFLYPPSFLLLLLPPSPSPSPSSVIKLWNSASIPQSHYTHVYIVHLSTCTHVYTWAILLSYMHVQQTHTRNYWLTARNSCKL